MSKRSQTILGLCQGESPVPPHSPSWPSDWENIFKDDLSSSISTSPHVKKRLKFSPIKAGTSHSKGVSSCSSGQPSRTFKDPKTSAPKKGNKESVKHDVSTRLPIAQASHVRSSCSGGKLNETLTNIEDDLGVRPIPNDAALTTSSTGKPPKVGGKKGRDDIGSRPQEVFNEKPPLLRIVEPLTERENGETVDDVITQLVFNKKCSTISNGGQTKKQGLKDGRKNNVFILVDHDSNQGTDKTIKAAASQHPDPHLGALPTTAGHTLEKGGRKGDKTALTHVLISSQQQSHQTALSIGNHDSDNESGGADNITTRELNDTTATIGSENADGDEVNRFGTLSDSAESDSSESDSASVPGDYSVVMDGDDFLPSFFVEPSTDQQSQSPVTEQHSITENSATELTNTTPTVSPNSSFSTSTSASGSRRRVSPRESSRKRFCNTSKWKANVRKDSYNKGKNYTSVKGKEKEAREMGPGCEPTCKRCKQRISMEDRVNIFKKFWGLGDRTRHWNFIVQHTVISSPAKKFALSDSAKGKSKSRKYFLDVAKKKYKVCKTMFCHTLGICDQWIDTALRKSGENGVVSPDKRGRHLNRPKRTPEELSQLVKEHINLFPRVQSHYSRTRTKREYVEHGLSIEEMYRRYKVWFQEKGYDEKLLASSNRYRTIFLKCFNIGFHKPRKDQCFKCKKWNYANPAKKLKIQAAYLRHRENRDLSLKRKDKDKKEAVGNAEICAACFDLQKVLTCPKSETSIFYYKQKLSLYNFTVFDMANLQGECFLWNETIASRGANEIASSMLCFISKKVQAGVKDFRFFSDSCSGQNKNRFLFSMYLFACVKFDVSISHCFLEPGHTYMEVDSMHGRIEQESLRKEIFTTNNWISLIKDAKKSGEQYTVTEMQSINFFNFKELVRLQQWKKGTDKADVKWSNIKEVSFNPQQPSIVKFSYKFGGDMLTVDVNKKNSVDLTKLQLPTAYPGKIPLKKKKAKDIRWCYDNDALPDYCKEFYADLLEGSDFALENYAVDFEVDCEPDKSDADESDDEDISDME